MNLSSYFKAARGSRCALAEKVGRSPAYLTHVATGFRRASIRLALAIEQATDGRVSRSDLRPDVWPQENQPADVTPDAGGLCVASESANP